MKKFSKKFFALIMACVMAFTLTAVFAEGVDNPDPDTTDDFTTTPVTPALLVIEDDYSRVQVTLVGEDDQPLANGEFNIVDEDGNVIDTVTSDEDGVVTFEQLPFGDITIEEKTPPTGYVKTDETHTVTVTDEFVNPESPVKIFHNNLIRTDVTINKVNKANQPVKGATIEVRNSDDEVIYTAVTGDDGTITVPQLLAGDYTYKETKTPEGYSLNTNTFSFNIDVMGNITSTTATN